MQISVYIILKSIRGRGVLGGNHILQLKGLRLDFKQYFALVDFC